MKVFEGLDRDMIEVFLVIEDGGDGDEDEGLGVEVGEGEGWGMVGGGNRGG